MAEEIEKVENVADSVMAAIEELNKAEEGIDTEGKIEEPEEEDNEEKLDTEEPNESDDTRDTKVDGDDKPDDEEPDEETGELKAPENWDKDRIAAFDGLENDASKQAYLDTFKSLEKGYNTKFEGLAETRKEHEEIVSIMAPLEQRLKQHGMRRPDAIRNLLAAQSLLETNPVAGLSHLIQTYGQGNSEILKQLGIGTQAAAEGEAYVDPDIATLRDQIGTLTNAFQQTQTNTQMQQNADAQNQVDLFEKAADESGSVLHPHFEQVRGTMGMLITGGHAATMDEAYGTAIRMDAGLHGDLMKAEREQAASKDNKKRKEAVAESKKAKNISTNNVAPDKEPAEPDSVLASVQKAAASV